MPLLKDPKRQFELDERAKQKSAQEARKAFRNLLTEVLPAVRKIKEALPGKDDKTIALRNKAFLKEVATQPVVLNFLRVQFSGGAEQEPFKRKAVTLLREAAFGRKPLIEGLEVLDGIAMASFQSRAMLESQAPLQDIPSELRAFLPKNLVVEVDPNGTLQRVTERFGNESRTLEVKINRMKLIVKKYNQIAKKIKKDMKSSDEITKLAAIVTSIIMETGIRPGDIGNAATIHAGGEKIIVETFGATTLGPEHVDFVRDNFAKLEFVGKKGTLNTAYLNDAEIIKALQDLVSKAQAGGSKYIFVTSAGKQFTYSDLSGYFRENLAGIDPTDFRKLRAAETIFTELTKSQEALYTKIRDFTSLGEKELRERVLDAIRETLGEAIEKSREALSHKSPTETIESYLDPRITLQFLSRGTLAKTLHDAILDNDLVVSFDPMKFVELASAKTVAAKWQRKASGEGRTLREILQGLEEALEGTETGA